MRETNWSLLFVGLSLVTISCQQQGNNQRSMRTFEEVRKEMGLSTTTLPSTYQVQKKLDQVLSGPVSKECGKGSEEVIQFRPRISRPSVLANNSGNAVEDVPSQEEMAELARSRVGCESLYSSVMVKKKEDLMKCYQSLKSTIMEDAFVRCTSGMNQRSPCLDRTKVFTNMYTKLSDKEQAFLSMTMTAQGEAGILAPPIEEMMMVMKVLKNRKENAIARGYGTYGINELDIALQPWQFSMYNNNDPNWANVLKSSPKSNKQVEYAVEAFVQFNNSSFTPEETFADVWHYHTNYIERPDWSTPSREVNDTIEVNGRAPKTTNPRHLFLSNVAWSFAYNDFRPRS